MRERLEWQQPPAHWCVCVCVMFFGHESVEVSAFPLTIWYGWWRAKWRGKIYRTNTIIIMHLARLLFPRNRTGSIMLTVSVWGSELSLRCLMTDCQSCPCGSGLADPQQCMVVVCVVVPDVVTDRVTKTVLVTSVCRCWKNDAWSLIQICKC